MRDDHHFDAIPADFQRKKSVVDYIRYNEDFETHWWQIIDILIIEYL